VILLVASGVFIVLSIIIGLVQLALAFGAPLGEFTLGGKFPGKLPSKLRIAALLQILVLIFFAIIVSSKAGMAFEGLYDFSKIAIWFIVAFFVLGSFLNLSSKSKKERLVMGPANIIALISVVIVAIG